ncbi:MAG: hypothetical protein M5R41_19545 [Bacteroidia bacterium]|nr:hypothetical protein [Bacteroidia bacterium]
MALALVAGACSVSGPPDHSGILDVREIEAQVWNDAMPGSKPRCNVSLHLMVTNVTRDTIGFRDAEAQLFDSRSGQPLRRFPPALLVNDQPRRAFVLAPGDSAALLFRSPSWGVEPVNIGEHPSVRVSVRMWTSAERPLLHTSEATTIFETQ